MMEPDQVGICATNKRCKVCESDQMGVIFRRGDSLHWVCGNCFNNCELVDKGDGKWF